MTPVHPSIHHSSQLSGILSRIVGHSILNNSLNNSNTLIIVITLVILVSSINHRYQSGLPKGDSYLTILNCISSVQPLDYIHYSGTGLLCLPILT